MSEVISVIITTYKRENVILKRAIDSVLRQTYTNIELIIVNDYYPNKDNIEQLLNTYNIPIQVFHNPKNMGACYSRNIGIKNSHGTYIAFLDDDDEWHPEKLQKQQTLMLPDVAMVYCTGFNIYPDGHKKEMSFIKTYSHANQLEHLLFSNYIGGCSFPLIRTAVLRELSGFDERLPSSQDYDLWIRICQQYRIVYLPQPMVLYHIMPDSITRSSKKRVKGFYLLLKKHIQLYKKYPHSAVNIYNNIIVVHVEHKEYGKVLLPIIKSFRFFPYNLSILHFWFTAIYKKDMYCE